MRQKPEFWLDVAVKLSLLALLTFGAFSGLERFAGKAFGWRLVGYSIAAFLVPAIWAMRGRRRSVPLRGRHAVRAAVPDRHDRQRAQSLRHDRLVG